MRTIPATVSRLALAGLLAALPLHAAFAQDATAVAERLKTLMAGQGLELNWSGIEGDASQMTIKGATVTATGEDDALPIGNITLEGISQDNGGFTIDTATTGAFSRTEDGMTLKLSPFVMQGITLPAENSTDPLASIMMYRSGSLEHMDFLVGDKTAASFENLRVDVTPPADGNPLEFTGGVERFTGDLSLVEDAKSRQVIDALGYQNISGHIEIAGSWQPADGNFTLSQYNMSVDNAGTFGFTLSIGGYTLDFIKSLQDLQKKMAAQPEGADSSAQGLAMLGLMQQLTFTGASIRFEDDSLTNKVLDYVGKQQGMSGKDIANQAKAIVPFGLAQLNNAELTAQASKAVNAFLDNPGSIEISANPPTPVPFAMIAAGAMSDPKTLTKTLGVSVTANED